MNLRCKAGDLAIYVGGVSAPLDVGKIVQCVRFVGNKRSVTGEFVLCLEIDPPLVNGSGALSICADKALRPIRDPGEDATDEMVAILGKPASQPSKEYA